MPVAAAGSPPPNRSTIASARSWLNVGEPYSSPTTLSGSPAAVARSAAARIFVGKSLPGGPYSQPFGRSRAARTTVQVRRPRRPPRPSPWSRRMGCPARRDRPDRRVARRSAGRRRPRSSTRPAGRGHASRRRSPVRRSPRRCGGCARSGSRAQPSTSVQAAVWTTTSGRSRSSTTSTPSGASRSKSARVHAIGP